MRLNMCTNCFMKRLYMYLVCVSSIANKLEMALSDHALVCLSPSYTVYVICTGSDDGPRVLSIYMYNVPPTDLFAYVHVHVFMYMYMYVVLHTGANDGSRVEPAGGGTIQSGCLQQETGTDGLL